MGRRKVCFKCPTCGGNLPGQADPYILADILPVGNGPRIFYRILAASMGKFVPKAYLISVLYGGTKDGGPLSAEQRPKQYAHELRLLLRPYGLAIDGDVKEGFRLRWD